MAKIKSFTDLQQSEELAKILPLDSADMYYWLAWSGGVSKEKRNTPKVGTPNKDAIKTYWCPCWSLSALLGVLPEINGIPLKIEKVKAEDGYDGYYYHIEYEGIVLIPYSKNPVDACVDMIIKLNELNLL